MGLGNGKLYEVDYAAWSGDRATDKIENIKIRTKNKEVLLKLFQKYLILILQ